MHHRINITLPAETVGLVDRLAGRGNRSRFIDQSIKEHVRATGRARLKRALAEGYARWSDADRRLAEEWFAIDERAWKRRAR